MYSLGIIFFEMCFRFKTGMERAHTLGALRMPKIIFPDAWAIGHLPKQREIVTSLLQHEPKSRPSATQLLTSPLVPSPEKQKEFYDNAIAELTNPRSTQYPALIDALFDSGARTHVDTRQDDYTYDNEHDDELHVWKTVVMDHLVSLFRRHGAVDDHLPLFVPETTLLNAFPDLKPVRLLDQLGTIVQLPSSDLLALARSASRRRIERIKRYHVGRKYASHPGGGQPIVTGELSFDIVSPVRSLVSEAELLEVVDKAITECQGARGSASGDYEFHVNHESVLATILASTPDRVRSQVLKAFKDLGAGVGSGHVRSRLSNVPGLSRALLDDLEQCTVTDEFGVVRRKLESVFSASRRKLSQAIDEVAVILQLARACGVNRRILFRPTLSRNAEFFRGGFMFEVVRRAKQKEIVAFGGRYDSLLEHFKEPAINLQPRKAYGVGMSIAVDQLARMVRKYESALSERLMTKDNEDERSFGFWSPARCDVYVAANSQVDLAARMGVAGDLWRAGIRADLQYDDRRVLEEVNFECLEQNILFLVIPRANRPTVKVRNVLKRSEEEVARSDLTTYLRAAIAEQRRVDATYAAAESASALGAAATAGGGADPSKQPGAANIKLVLPPEPVNFKPGQKKPVRKFRHVTKSVYYDKAADFLAQVHSALPLIAVDLAAPLLAQLALDPAWVTDDEPWRAVLAALPSAERAYAENVREAVRDTATKGSCWLFALREGRGFLLQLAK
ncbi:eukaryotic translation initiation factor 2-alpha kinase [Cryptotrichosporon argae]